MGAFHLLGQRVELSGIYILSEAPKRVFPRLTPTTPHCGGCAISGYKIPGLFTNAGVYPYLGLASV